MTARTRLLGVTAVALLLLGGCSDEPTPAVEIGALPSDLGAAIEVPEASDILAFDSWPKACDLVSDEVLQALLPQVTSIERESGDTDITLISSSGNVDVTAIDAECRIWPRIPIGALDTAEGTSLNVTVDFVGSPEAVEINFHPADNEMVEIEGGECFVLTEDALTCRTDAGTLVFTVALHMAFQSTDPEDPNVYTVGGESTEFTVDVTASSEERTAIYRERAAFLQEHITQPLAASILQRLAG